MGTTELNTLALQAPLACHADSYHQTYRREHVCVSCPQSASFLIKICAFWIAQQLSSCEQLLHLSLASPPSPIPQWSSALQTSDTC